MEIFRKIRYVGVVIVVVSMLSGVASADYPGTVTVDSCSTNGVLFSASGTFSDNDGVIDVSIYANGVYRGGATFWPPKTGDTWSISNSAVPSGDEYTCISVTATITDVNDDTTSSAPCYAGVPERCWDGKENDCDGKTDCDDSDCNEQVCNREDYPYHWYCCGGLCVDTNTDPNNCGSCGNICPPENPICEEGECVPEASTLVLFAVGLLSLAGYVGLKKRKAK
jgi:hypothetical protein